ncbi:MAG: histidinol-phosphate transaminase [Hyphomicrobiales bacterium]
MNNQVTDRPVPRSGVMRIAPYVPGKNSATGVDPKSGKVFKLSSNENPLGSSSKATTAVATMNHLEDYPDGGARLLREAIADQFNLNSDQIVCSSGSDELLSLLGYAYLNPGDEAIYTEHGFLVYRIVILAAGAKPIVASEVDETAHVDNILAAVTLKTKVIYLANPNNPTGTYLPASEVNRLHKGLRSDILLVLDAAYAEYVDQDDYEAGIELVKRSENVVMTRTFSKIHGLANLRLGWCFASKHIVDAINRIRGPFNVNGAAIAAGQVAVKDNEHIARSIAHNNTFLRTMSQGCTALGLDVTPSVGNFILVHFPEKTESNAEAADQFLQSKGCVVRRVGAYGFPNALRISIGTEEANIAVLNALKEFLNK